MTPIADPTPPSVRRSQRAWRSLRWSMQTITPRELLRLLLILASVYVIFWLATATWPALAPFVAGAIAAYIMAPVVNRLDRFMPRPLAVGFTVAALVAVIGGFLALLVPAIVGQAARLIALLPGPDQMNALTDQATAFRSTLPPAVQVLITESVAQVSATARANLLRYWSQVVSLVIGGSIGLLGTIGFVLGFLVVPGWLLTVLHEQRNGVAAVNRVLPGWMQADFWAVARIIDRAFSAFIRGQVVVGIAVGLLTYVGLRLLTVLEFEEPSNRLLLATLNGALALVPQIGPVVGLVVAALIGLTQSPQTAVIMVALFVSVNLVVGRFVAPRLERQITDIPPTILVLAIVALSGLGLIWVLLAAPVAAIARELFRYAFGRLSEPPRPAGLLPGEPVRPATMVVARRHGRRTFRPRSVPRATAWQEPGVRVSDG